MDCACSCAYIRISTATPILHILFRLQGPENTYFGTNQLTILFIYCVSIIYDPHRRFGFPNQAAIDEGKQGTDCRGEEHDVTLVWSISSGKRMLMSNGQQIYVGIVKGKIFEHMWTDTRSGTHMRIVAYSTAPSYNTPGTRQYDLFIDGKSFFALPKVYEIGLRGTAANRIPGVITDSDRKVLSNERAVVSYSESGRDLVAPASAKEEEEDLKKAIRASLEESRQFLSSRGKMSSTGMASSATGTGTGGGVNEEESLAASTLTNTIVESDKAAPAADVPLIDFLDAAPTPTAPAPVAAVPTTPTHALIPVQQPATQYQVDPLFGTPTRMNHAAAGASAALEPMGGVAPAPIPTVDEFAPQAPTYQDISDQILLNYTPPATANSVTNASATSANPFDDPPPAPANPFGAAPAPVPMQIQQEQMDMQYQQHYQQGNNF